MLKCPFCGYFGTITDFELDHSIPISRLTGVLPGNLKYVCSGCNRQKGDKTDSEYSLWRLLNFFIANYGPIKNK